MAKKTGYFVEDHADIMERLRAGTATAADQILAANALQEADQYEDAYHFCTEQIEPYVQRAERPNGLLPASLCDSVTMLLEFWNENRNNPAINVSVMANVRRALATGAKYSLASCEEALAKLDTLMPKATTQRVPTPPLRLGFPAPGFPARLKKCREEAGFGRGYLAVMMRVHESTIAHYEAGNITPQGRTVIRLATVLQIPLAKLRDGEVEQPIKVTSDQKHSVDEETE